MTTRATADRPRTLLRRAGVLLALLVALWSATGLAFPDLAAAQDGGPIVGTDTGQADGAATIDVPDVPDVTFDDDTGGEDGLTQTVTILLLVTIGSVAPAILLLMTSFTRYIVVLSLTRNALGLQTVPPAQVLIGLALFLSMFTMGPVFSEVNEVAVQPMLAGDISQTEALSAGFEPMRDFMVANTRQEELQLFIDLAGDEQPATVDDVSATTLIPAFVISELRAAFLMGFVIFIPFLVIDLVVAAVLMSLGMMMLPPVFVSLPVKLLLFVLVDGWVLITGSLVQSVQGVT